MPISCSLPESSLSFKRVREVNSNFGEASKILNSRTIAASVHCVLGPNGVLVSHYKHNLRNTTRVLQQMISILSGYISSMTLLLKILSVIFIFDPSKIVSISKRKKVLPYQKSLSALKVSERFVLTLSELMAAIFTEFQSEAKYNISCSTNYRPRKTRHCE